MAGWTRAWPILVAAAALPALGCGQAVTAPDAGGCGDTALCADVAMNAAEERTLDQRVAAGDRQAMETLAFRYLSRETGNPDRNREMAQDVYRRGARLGSCSAVRALIDPPIAQGMSASERRHWQAEDRRRGCSVDRWEARPDGSVRYTAPEDGLWEMRVDCVDGAVRIAGAAGINRHDDPRIFFQTSRGVQERAIEMVDYELTAAAFTAGPDDEVLQALLRGETIRPGRHVDDLAVDGSGAPALLRPLVERCRAGRSGSTP